MENLRLGIIGGLGTETSCNFLLSLNSRFRKAFGKQPDVVMTNLSITNESEEKIIKGEFSPEHLKLLKEAVRTLNSAWVDFIVIPCNTVHVFIDELRRESSVPIISIIEETAKACAEKGLLKVGLLASGTTVKQGLFDNELGKIGVDIILPGKEEQEKLNEAILNALNGRAAEEDRSTVKNLTQRMLEQGAEAVILGCTDLQLLVSDDFSGKTINSLKALEDSLFLLPRQSSVKT